MGLTIHYTLNADTRTAMEAWRLMEQLRTRALDLPFAKVGVVVELTGEACDSPPTTATARFGGLRTRRGRMLNLKDAHYR